MCSSIHQYQIELSVILFPDQQPIGLYVAFPTTFVFPLKFVWTIFLGQLTLFLQDVKHNREGCDIQPTADTMLQRPFELASIDYFIHR